MHFQYCKRRIVMNVRRKILISSILFIALAVAMAAPSAVYASGVVGTGSAGSCTDGALNSALATGGLVTFNCGAAPLTIIVGSTKVISINTQIDGGGLITLSGNNLFRVF